MNTPVELDLTKITSYVYVYPLSGNQIRIVCNYCGTLTKTFYEGDCNAAPDTDWLQEMLEHLGERHPEAWL